MVYAAHCSVQLFIIYWTEIFSLQSNPCNKYTYYCTRVSVEDQKEWGGPGGIIHFCYRELQ
jgi:hypothetical protein